MTTPVILIGSDATPTYNENAAPVVLDNSLALSDADAPTVGSDIDSATVTITGGFIAGDVLAADATGTAIAVSYSNGVLTLSGADTLADYQAVLKTITFQSSSDNPTDFGAAATRTIEWVVTDLNGESSVPQTLTLSVNASNDAPTATAQDVSATRGQVISASSLFQASDADNNSLTYFFYDNSADPTSGHFTVNGVVQPAGTTFAVSAAQLAQTTFTAGSLNSDDLFVNVYDGMAFSGPQEFHVNVPANHTPTVTASDVSATKGQTISASSLFQASDADGDGLTYFFYDNSADPTSGHFTVNGVVQAAGTTFAVSAAQLAQTTFTAGSLNSDDLFVNVYDGMAFSGPQEFHVNVPANHTPTVTASDVSATKGQTISASSLFQASDADGDGLTYFFYDNSADPTSGHFTVNGVVQAAGTTFAVSAAQLAQTTFTAGSLNSDDLFVNVYDGMAFSGPQEFHVNVPANHTPTVTTSDVSATKGQTISASSLFQASDADGDGLTYFFYDNSADPTSGHFTVNGVVQAAGTTFAVSAAQLAQTTFTAGSFNSDDLFVNVYDGDGLQRTAGIPHQHSRQPRADGDGDRPNGAERTSHERVVVVPGERRRRRWPHLFLLRQQRGPHQRPLHRQRRGAGRRHDLRGVGGAAGADHFHGRHRWHRGSVRKCLGWFGLQRTAGVPHRRCAQPCAGYHLQWRRRYRCGQRGGKHNGRDHGHRLRRRSTGFRFLTPLRAAPTRRSSASTPPPAC